MSRRDYKTFIELYNNTGFKRIEDQNFYFTATKFAAKGIQKKLNEAAMGLYEANGEPDTYYFRIRHVGMTLTQLADRKKILIG